MSGSIVGIDIGSASVRAIEVKHATKARPVVLKYHEVPLSDGSVRRGEVLEVATVTDALKRLWSLGGFKTKDVVIGMGGPRVLSRDLSVPKASLLQMQESLPFHVQDMLPLPVDETLLDFYPISELAGETGPMVKGLLVAAVKEAVVANVKAVTDAGLRPVQVDLIPFALARALAPRGTVTGLSAVVSVGANTTNVVIVLDGVPQFVRIIAAGGDDITRALATRLAMFAPEAEALKRTLGLASSRIAAEQRIALEIVYEVAGELLTSIRNTLTYYTNTKPGSALERVVLSGGGGQLTGFSEALSEVAGVPVVLVDPLSTVAVARDLQSDLSGDRHAAMTTAFGLALGASA